MKFNKKTELAAEQQLKHLIDGQINNLEAVCSQYLKQKKNHPYFLLCVAVLRYAGGEQKEADQLFNKAFAIAKGDALTLYNMSIPLVTYGINDWAERVLEKAAKLAPKHPETHYHLGLTYLAKKRTEEALDALEKASELAPDWVEPSYKLATLCHQAGYYLRALRSYKRAVEIDSSKPDILCQFANLLMQFGEYQKAEHYLELAFKEAPNDKAVILTRTRNFLYMGRVKDAFAIAVEAQKQQQKSELLLSNLALVYSSSERVEEALDCYQDARRLDPNNIAILTNIAMCKARLTHYNEALETLDELLGKAPDNIKAIRIKGELLAQTKGIDCAIAYVSQQIEQGLYSPSLHGQLIYYMMYSDHFDPLKTKEEAEKWSQRVPIKPGFMPPADNDKTVDRQIRIGYISPDFRNHALVRHFENFLANHDHERFHITGYASVQRADKVTYQIMEYFDNFRFVSQLSDEELAGTIRSDKIDILIDLAGHTDNNSLTALKYKPAPIQASWLGCPGTTGMKEIDYYFTIQAHNSPENQKYFVEHLAFLREYNSFKFPESPPDEGEPPVVQSGQITFGSFNRPHKITDEMIETWGRILKRLPKAKLLMKNKVFGDPKEQEIARERYAALGVPAEQLLFEGSEDFNTYLRSYWKIDIGLDTAPYNGSTISMDMLFMGIPFITLKGDTDFSSQGAYILESVDLNTLIAHSPDEYVELAVSLSQDVERLKSLRKSLRGRFIKFSKPEESTRDLEHLYEHIWKRHCEGIAPETLTLSERYDST